MSNELLQQIGTRVGLDNLSFDETGQCVLALDDSLFIAIRDEGDHWVFSGMLNSISELESVFSDMAHFYKDILRVSHRLTLENRGCIGIDEEGGILILTRLVSLEGACGESLSHELEQFAHTLEHTIKHLAFEEPDEPEVAPKDDSIGADQFL